MSTLVPVRQKRILTSTETCALLGKQIFLDCLASKWLKPCTVKQNERRDRSLYSMRDIENCEARMEQGEYPQP